MGFRFSRSIRLVPGIRLNLSKTGPSVSVGEPGATANFGTKRMRGTVGLPGSGLSYSQSSAYGSAFGPGRWIGYAIVGLAIVAAVIKYLQ